jgi:hypothetical protein
MKKNEVALKAQVILIIIFIALISILLFILQMFYFKQSVGVEPPLGFHHALLTKQKQSRQFENNLIQNPIIADLEKIGAWPIDLDHVEKKAGNPFLME